MIQSHWKELWMTRKASRVFLEVPVTPCELFLLIEGYSWPPESLSLGLEVRWPWEQVSNKFQTRHFWIQKVSLKPSEAITFTFDFYILNVQLIFEDINYTYTLQSWTFTFLLKISLSLSKATRSLKLAEMWSAKWLCYHMNLALT